MAWKPLKIKAFSLIWAAPQDGDLARIILSPPFAEGSFFVFSVPREGITSYGVNKCQSPEKQRGYPHSPPARAIPPCPTRTVRGIVYPVTRYTSIITEIEEQGDYNDYPKRVQKTKGNDHQIRTRGNCSSATDRSSPFPGSPIRYPRGSG